MVKNATKDITKEIPMENIPAEKLTNKGNVSVNIIRNQKPDANMAMAK